MEIIKYSNLSQEEKQLVNKAIMIAEQSNFGADNKIGCVILCKNGDEFYGAVMDRTRAIGSTCAERMAVD
ncbi:MAG: hypothetical protein PHI53_02665 [Candidatus Pacebacteria bacterium]|nr:hypothetical protein [Candidatus Paceibacterota bacterium]